MFTNVATGGYLPQSPPAPVSPFPVLSGDRNFDATAREFFYSHAYEDSTNNLTRATLPVVYREPDLRVTDLVLPDTASAGSVIDVTFTVSNVGNRETREAGWVDRIFLSFDNRRPAAG